MSTMDCWRGSNASASVLCNVHLYLFLLLEAAASPNLLHRCRRHPRKRRHLRPTSAYYATMGRSYMKPRSSKSNPLMKTPQLPVSWAHITLFTTKAGSRRACPGPSAIAACAESPQMGRMGPSPARAQAERHESGAAKDATADGPRQRWGCIRSPTQGRCRCTQRRRDRGHTGWRAEGWYAGYKAGTRGGAFVGMAVGLLLIFFRTRAARNQN